jgi:hypothetical protein
LNQAGVVAASGFSFAYLVGRLDVKSLSVELQFRGICGGAKLESLRSLATRLQKPTETIYPYLEIRTARLPEPSPDRCCWVMPIRIEEKVTSPHSDESEIERAALWEARELCHAFYVHWLGGENLQDMLFLSGLRLRDGKFLLTDPMSPLSSVKKTDVGEDRAESDAKLVLKSRVAHSGKPNSTEWINRLLH